MVYLSFVGRSILLGVSYSLGCGFCMYRSFCRLVDEKIVYSLYESYTSSKLVSLKSDKVLQYLDL